MGPGQPHPPEKSPSNKKECRMKFCATSIALIVVTVAYSADKLPSSLPTVPAPPPADAQIQRKIAALVDADESRAFYSQVAALVDDFAGKQRMIDKRKVVIQAAHFMAKAK